MTALVLVHGYLGSNALWRAEAERFSGAFDVIAPDLPGFGSRGEEAAPNRIEGFAADILAGLDARGIGRFVLVGHSMGGMIAQSIAASVPDRVGRLVLYGTGPRGVLPDRFEPIAASRDRLRREGVGPTARRIAATWYGAGECARAYDACAAVAERTPLQAALAGLDAMEGWDGRDALSRITAPTLVVWGDRDRSYGWPQPEALWRGIAGAQLAVMPDCAHNAHQEKPELFGLLLHHFLHDGAGVRAG